jgi:hypothetical protein
MKIVVVKIAGGLGNQLFTFSAAKRLAHINNARLIIDNISGFKNDRDYNRSYMLNNFYQSYRLANKLERLPNTRLLHKFFMFINKCLKFENRFYIIQEDINFDIRLIKLKLKYKYTYIQDLWQSENYFIDIDYIIRKDLFIKLNDWYDNKNYYNNILSTNSVAVHVRFFQNSLNSSFTLNDLYYLNAIEKISKIENNPIFYFFSDRPELLVDLLKKVNKQNCIVINIPNSYVNKDLFEFFLMKNCKHHIIANSTFSWWAAWLGKNNNQIVISPDFKSLTGICGWGFKGLIPEKWKIL